MQCLSYYADVCCSDDREYYWIEALDAPAYIGQRHYKLSSARYINANSLFTHYLVFRGRGKGLGRKVDTAVRGRWSGISRMLE